MLPYTTLRQGRRQWCGLLLYVMLALLPLRGWAETVMHLSAPTPHGVVGEASIPPCHAAMAEPDGTTSDESPSGCSLCSLCHGFAVCLGEAGIAVDAASWTAAAVVPQGHGPLALPLPERPPRA